MATTNGGGVKPALDQKKVDYAIKRFDYLTAVMIVKFPFIHQVFSILLKTPSPSLDTMGVWVSDGGRFNMKYNPEFVDSLTDAEMTFVFYHEVLHLVLHHCTHRKFNNQKLGNVATDLAINDLIPTDSTCAIPVDKDTKAIRCLLVSEFKKNPLFADIENKKSAEWYYDYLQRKNKEDPNNPVWSYEKGDGSGLDKEIDSHEGWGEDELGDEKIRAKVNEIDKMDSWGSVSEGMRETIRQAQIRKIDWSSIFRAFYGRMAGKIRHATRKRPNRRTMYMHPGYKKDNVDKHLIAIDTSGSTQGYLPQFLAVLNQVIDYVDIDVMQFDCEKQTEPVPYDRKRIEFEFKGMGGTDFEPVMKVVEERRYKSVAIVTDGQASPPRKPDRAKVVWILPTGCNPPVDWGQKIHMDLER